LKNVAVGDKVTVEDTLGNDFKYVITERYFVETDAPNRLEIFESSDDASEITLITCGGVWLPYEGTYNSRLVIKGYLE
jgi:sortase (surface protein transpeptidase)